MNPTIKSLLSNRNFVLLWCAYGISAVGDHLSEMAILAHRHGLDPNVDITPMQARMTFMFMLPFFAVGWLMGVMADRIPRRWIMIAADLSRVAIMLVFLTLIDRCALWFGDAWGPYIPLALVGLFAAMFSPARAAMVPTLVGNQELVSANAMIGGLGMIATMFATLISGALADAGLIQLAFHLDAGTFALSAMCLAWISVSPREASGRLDSPRDSVFDSIVSGGRYIKNHRRIAGIIAVGVVFWVSGAVVRSVIPAVVKEVYHGGFSEMARFPVWIGSGLVIGAVIITLLGSALRSEVAITWSLMGAGVGILGLAVSVFVPVSASTASTIGACSVFVAGLFGAGIAATCNAMLQRFVPDRYRGRVFGVYNVATVGGVLVATGALAVPQWSRLDAWAGYILVGAAALLFSAGALSLIVRLRTGPLGGLYAFFRNIDEVFVKSWYRLEVVGRCTIPRTGPVIVTANHVCPVDPNLIMGACNYRQLKYMVAAEYTNLPFARHFIRIAECIPVRRGDHDVGATKAALRCLRQGDAIGIFIQGGIRGEPSEEDLKNGVAMLALRTGARVIPVHIDGMFNHRSIFISVIRRHHARLVFGPAVDLSEFANAKGRDTLTAASRKIYAAITALAPEGDPRSSQPDRPPAT